MVATLKLNFISTSNRMLTTFRNHITPGSAESVIYSRLRPTDTSLLPFSVTQTRASFEDFYEEITPNDDGSRRDWKSFEHYKRWTGPNPTMCSTAMCPKEGLYGFYPATYVGTHSDVYYGYRNLYGEPGSLNVGLPVLYLKRPSDFGFVPEPANLNAVLQDALRNLLPGIKAELSLVNSVIELKDFKSLPKTIANILKIGKLATTVGKTLREMLRASADAFLQAKFNVLPLLSDISGIKTALSRTESRINDLIVRSGSPQNRHFAFKWGEFTDVTETNYPGSYQGTNSFWSPHLMGLCYNWRHVTYQPSEFHAQIQYNFSFTDYQLAHAQALALLDAAGLNFNPAIIWNAIPWSFVIDWVAGVSRFLNQFAFEQMKPKINIRRFLWSVRRQRQILVTKKIGYNTGTPLKPFVSENPLPIVYETAYRRTVGLPSSSSIVLGGLNLSEFSLAAALVISRRRRSHKRWKIPATK